MPSHRESGQDGLALGQQTPGRSELDWEAATRKHLDASQWFLAYDTAQTALQQFPQSVKLQQFAARALIKVGALEEARKRLESLCPEFQLSDSLQLRVYTTLRRILEVVGNAPQDDHPSPERLALLAQLVGDFAAAGETWRSGHAPDEMTLGLLGRVYKGMWEESGDRSDALRSRNMYLRAFRTTGGHWPGINAATVSWLIGEKEIACGLARQVLERCETVRAAASGTDLYWIPATIGEVQLLLGNETLAIDAYRQAAQAPGRKGTQILSSLQHLRLLEQHGLRIPAEIYRTLKTPTVVIFAGHMIDQPERPAPRFPPELEFDVRREIERHLDGLEARIGYCSAACGSDILFTEAMQDRDGEVNVVLPFAEEDFIKTSVAHAGPHWVRRFRKALKLADSVAYATREGFLNTDGLFAFADQIFHGYAYLRARSLATQPYLLAVYDETSPRFRGGTADIVARWIDPERLRIVRIRELLRNSVATNGPARDATPRTVIPESDRQASVRVPAKRLIKSILFGDVVGFTRLQEEHVPFFMYRFLQQVSDCLKQLPIQPQFVNTWGDAIFAVMDRAMPLAEYALALQNVVCGTKWEDVGLPAGMSMRIGLHVGPVFEGTDPVTGALNFYGSHVNRAARIEPITVPGHIYASEQFIAVLTAEQIAAGIAPAESPVSCEYLGKQALAKGFGPLTVYHLRGKRCVAPGDP